MSATNATETAALTALLDGVTLYVSLHTANPGETGTQATSETTYTGYARQSTTLSISGDTASNGSQVNFPQCTNPQGEVLTHFGLGTSETGAGSLMFYAELQEPVTLQNLMTPAYEVGTLKVVCD